MDNDSQNMEPSENQPPEIAERWQTIERSPTKRRVIELLSKQGRMSIPDVAAELRVTPSQISELVPMLKRMGIVSSELKERRLYIQLHPNVLEEYRQWRKDKQLNKSLCLRIFELLEEGGDNVYGSAGSST